MEVELLIFRRKEGVSRRDTSRAHFQGEPNEVRLAEVAEAQVVHAKTSPKEVIQLITGG